MLENLSLRSKYDPIAKIEIKQDIKSKDIIMTFNLENTQRQERIPNVRKFDAKVRDSILKVLKEGLTIIMK